MKSSRALARLSFAVVCLMVLAMGLIGGCKKDEPGVVDPPLGGGGGGGTVTDSIRFAALATFTALRNSIDYTNPAAYTQILQYFRSHPETYEASDTSGPKSIWARFKDGRLFIISDDTEIHSESSSSFLSSMSHARSLKGGTDNLPSDARARFLNALGPAFDPITGGGAAETVTDLRNWFSAIGYSAPPSGDASVDGLKQVQGGDGVFYISSHGSWGHTRTQPNGDSTEYGIWTTDEVTPANDARFATDLNSNPPRLCWYSARDRNSIFGNNFPVHYAITGQFVRDYMRFGTNSLVFFNACRSAQFDFPAACIARGAGVYLGWTNNIDVWQGLKAGRFFLDRLIGANHQPPAENPPQRPFEITYVLEDMLLRNMDSHVGNKGPTFLAATPPYGWGGEPKLIAPTLQVAVPPWIQGDVNVLIDGAFGNDPRPNGTVLLGSTPLTIASWTPSRIECLPPASGGNLVVKVRGIKSNPLQLTEWHAQFVIIFRGVQHGPNVVGTLQHRVTLNLNFWADIHSWRVLPNKPTNFWAQRHIYVMPNSSCQFESSGEYRSTLDTNIIIESWSNAVTPQLSRWFTEPSYFGLRGSIDSVGRQSRLDVVFRGEFTRTQNGSPSQDYFTPPSEMTAVIAALTSGYGIPQGSLPWSSGEYSGSMTWTAISPQYPPDPSGGW